MEKQITDNTFLSILFQALLKESAFIPGYFKTAYLEIKDRLDSEEYYFNELCNALEKLREDYRLKLHNVAEENYKLIDLGYIGGIQKTEVYVNATKYFPGTSAFPLIGIDQLNILLHAIQEYKKKLNRVVEKPEDKSQVKIESFTWSGNQEQLQKLYEELKNENHGFIDPKTDFKDFSEVFSGKTTNTIKPVTWCLKSRGNRPHKTALREFLTLLLDHFSQKTVQNCFIDLKGNPIKLSKPKKGEYSNYYQSLEIIVNKVKNLKIE